MQSHWEWQKEMVLISLTQSSQEEYSLGTDSLLSTELYLQFAWQQMGLRTRQMMDWEVRPHSMGE